jgi:alpha-L-fucosidase
MNEKTTRSYDGAVTLGRRIYPAIIVVALCFLSMAGCRQEGDNGSVLGAPGGKKVLSKDKRMQWWNEARFGMFIHWGLYAVPAGEWKGEKVPGIGEWIMERAKIPVSEYEPLAKQFNPVKFDAEQWVQIAKNAGMKYIVITSKHHDGFCLWDTKYTDYDVVDATPFKRDILGELAAECRKRGIRLCFYH